MSILIAVEGRMTATISTLIKRLPLKLVNDAQVQSFLQQVKEGYYCPLSISLNEESEPDDLKSVNQIIEEYAQLNKDIQDLMQAIPDNDTCVDLIDLKRKWQALTARRITLAVYLPQLKNRSNPDNGYGLVQTQDEKAAQSIAKLRLLINHKVYYIYGVNLITLGFLSPQPQSGQFQFLNVRSLFISPQAFQALDKEAAEYQHNLALLVGMTDSPYPFSPMERKIVENLQLKKCEIEYERGLSLISPETLQLVGEEKAQKKLATLIGRQFLLKTLSENDTMLLKSSVELISLKQKRSAQGTTLGSKAAFFLEGVSIANDPTGWKPHRTHYPK